MGTPPFFLNLKRKISHPLSMRIRLLPLVIMGATLMLATRLYDIKTIVEGSDELFGIAEVNAEPSAGGAPAKGGETPSAATSDAKAEKFPSLADPKDINSTTFDPLNLTAEEVKLLENLSTRKAGLDAQETAIKEKELVLKTVEERMAKKVAELQKLKQDIEGLVKTHDANENLKLKKLIKIYETMKPADAARLFSEMDLSVLLEVLGQMKESKTAPILAKMEPGMARTVTEELARQQDLTDAAKDALKTQAAG